MSQDRVDMDIDNQSEDGEIKKSPLKDMDDFSFSEEEGGDTADSLDIKPPQAVVRHHKSTSSRRREKHSDRRDRREEKERMEWTYWSEQSALMDPKEIERG
ncbi:hypothetical protein KM043_018284 [Ampulex compressa]|nr:hypothetical protein KM043_018284 [Ampulex compressa]